MNNIIVALTSHLFDDPQLISRSQWRLLRPLLTEGITAAEVSEAARSLMSDEGASRVKARLALVPEVEERLQELAAHGIVPVTELDEAYPQQWNSRLKDQHPPTLFCAGNLDLLNRPSVGVVGSRDVDRAGAAYAGQIGRQVHQLGYGVVSGAARGVDQIAMIASFEAGGTWLALYTCSLAREARQLPDEVLESGRVCLCTAVSPYSSFTVGNAMARNRLIYAHSLATVVVASGDGSGGTWAGAVDALENDLCPLLVREDSTLPGNSKLIELGGRPLVVPSELEKALTVVPTEG